MTDELEHRFTLPDDEDLDDFESGVDEVDDYFRTREWFNVGRGKAAPPTYSFLSEDGERVGYAAVAFRENPHPNDASPRTAKYLVVYVVGVDQNFQGAKHPETGQTYAVMIFKTLTRFARDRGGCAGLSLWVRTANARAIAFYEKIGFEPDEGGPVARDDGAPHLTMRKVLG